MNPERFTESPEAVMPKDYFSSVYFEIMGITIDMDILTLRNEDLPPYLRAIALSRLSEFVDIIYEGEEGLQ